MKLRNKKTGEIKELGCIHLIEKNLKTLNAYKRLTQLNEEWEDYKPAEPLIKDERIRKAVKAWAEANEIETVTYYTCSHFWYLRSYCREQGIDFWLKWDDRPEMVESHEYTITELCGEEEE